MLKTENKPRKYEYRNKSRNKFNPVKDLVKNIRTVYEKYENNEITKDVFVMNIKVTHLNKIRI
jgi:hypothetical protein